MKHDLKALRRQLLSWYRRHARDLPWRRTRDPYHVWVSEIMLQQTQVATVIDYFNRFISILPTIAALAAADEQDVLRLWEGLGYYRRARQMHKAARVIVAEHDGAFPADIEAVRRLPGIGRYTAGAILSIAFDQSQPILEANTIRLYSRLLAHRGATHSTAGQTLLWQFAEDVLPRRGAGSLNQALMELGATVCLPREPRCDVCPLMSHCPTFAHGQQAVIPAPKAKPRIEQVREAAVVVRRQDAVLLIKRGNEERWAGLWDFPRVPVSGDLEVQLRELTGVRARQTATLGTIRHSVTRFRITLDCHEARYVSHTKADVQAESRWVTETEILDLPLSMPARRLSQLLWAMPARRARRRRAHR